MKNIFAFILGVCFIHSAHPMETHDNELSIEIIQGIPDEIHVIIFSFVPASDLVQALRVNKIWQKLVSQTLESCPEKYLELCEVGFKEKKYSKILDPIFTNPTLYKKFIHHVSFKKNIEEYDLIEHEKHMKAFSDKLAKLKSESPKDLFSIALITREKSAVSLFQNITPPKELTLKRVLALLISLGASLNIMKDVKGCEKEFEACYKLCRQCINSEFSEEDFRAILKKLDEHYIVINFFVSENCSKSNNHTLLLGFPLLLAVEAENQKAVEFLVNEGLAEINLINNNSTPLSKDYYQDSLAIAEFLAKNGLSLSIKYNTNGFQSITYRADPRLDEMKFLAEHGEAPLENSLYIARQQKQLYPHLNIDEMIKYLEALSLAEKKEGK